MRWTLCAQEICHSVPLFRDFFLTGKTLPVARGQGVTQPIMDVVAQQIRKGTMQRNEVIPQLRAQRQLTYTSCLQIGDWVHIFPEGKVNHNPSEMLPFRWGIGKLACDAVAKEKNGEDEHV